MTREHRIYQLAHWIASFIIAAVLLSGYHKMLYPSDFAVSVYRFHVLPGFLVNIAALYLPWLELVCALCLLFITRCRGAALWMVLILLAGFTAGLGINLWRGSVFGCGCFGRGATDQPLSGLSIARNIALMALTGLALVAQRKTDRMRADGSRAVRPCTQGT